MPQVNVRSPWVLGGLSLGVLVGTAMVVAFDPTLVSNDAIQHLRAARYLLSGEGYRTDLLYYDLHYLGGSLPAPETHWPPGFSLAVAALAALGLPLVGAGLTVAMLGFFGTGWALWTALRRMGHSQRAALGWTLPWLLYLFAISEVLRFSTAPLLSATGLLGLLAVMSARDRPDRRTRAALAAGSWAALGLSFHFSGLAFLGALSAWYAYPLVRERSLRRAVPWLGATAPAALLTGALFLRSSVLTGTISSQAMTVDRTPPLEVARGLSWALNALTGIRPDGFVAGEATEWLFVALVALVVASVVVGRLKQPGTEVPSDAAPMRAKCSDALGLGGLYLTSMSIFLVALSLSNDVRYVANSRYWLPLLPFAILAGAVGWRALRVRAAGHDRRLALVTALVACACFGAGERELLARVFREGSSGEVSRIMGSPADPGSLAAFVRDSTDVNTRLVANESQFLGLLVDRPVLGFPPAPFRSALVTADTVRQAVDTYGVEYVFFFASLFDPTDPANSHLEFFSDLGNRSPEWLEQIVDRPEVRVYRVR